MVWDIADETAPKVAVQLAITSTHRIKACATAHASATTSNQSSWCTLVGSFGAAQHAERELLPKEVYAAALAMQAHCLAEAAKVHHACHGQVYIHVLQWNIHNIASSFIFQGGGFVTFYIVIMSACQIQIHILLHAAYVALQAGHAKACDGEYWLPVCSQGLTPSLYA